MNATVLRVATYMIAAATVQIIKLFIILKPYYDLISNPFFGGSDFYKKVRTFSDPKRSLLKRLNRI
jgi:hypothetical protein